MTRTRLLSTAALLVLFAAPAAVAQVSTYPSATMPPGTVVSPAAPSAGVVAAPPGSVVAPPGSVVLTQPAQIGSGTSVPGSMFGVTTDCATVSGATSGGMRGTTTALDCRQLGTAR
jgi:hypothetical protein